MARAIAIALVIGFSIGLIYSFVKRNQGGASQTLIRNAVAAGRVALIRIDGIRTTGMFINDQPVCELEVTVQPRQGQAFRTRLSRRVTYVEIPQYQPGELLPGVVLTHDGPEAAFVTDPVLYGEVEARVAGLTVPPAATAGEVRYPPAGSVRDDGTRRASFVGRGRRAGRGAQ